MTENLIVERTLESLPQEVAAPEKGLMATLTRAAASRWWPLTLFEQFCCIAITLVMVGDALITICEVVGRATVGLDIEWYEEAGVVMITTIAFLGGAVGYRRHQFAALNVLGRFLTPKRAQIMECARDSVVFVFALFVTIFGWSFIILERGEIDPFLFTSESWIQISYPIGMTLILLFSLERLVFAKAYRLAGLAIAAALVGVVLIFEATGVLNASPRSCVFAMVVLGAILIVTGFPLPFVFGIGGFVYVYLTHSSYDLVPSDMIDSLSDFVLVAIPFFLVTGFVMSAGGLSDKIAKAIRVTLRRVPGGLMHVIIYSMFVFSGVSGSKVGDMAAVGQSAVRMAEAENYPVEEAIAVLCAGGAMGDTIPPSTGLIVLASISLLSVAALFAGGLLPAVAAAVALSIFICLRYRKRPSADIGVRGKERMRIIADGVPVLIVPVLLIGGIISGIATPTEISAIAIAVAVIMVYGVYRSVSTRLLIKTLMDSCVLGGVVLFIVANATLFARVLTLAQIPQSLSSLVTSGHVGGKWGFMFGSVAILILLGMLMEGLPSLLVCAPLFIPIATTLGINPIQYGIIVIIAIGIGTHTPPIGAALFVGAQIGKVEVRKVNRCMWPYLIPLYAALFAVMLVPEIVIWLPGLLKLSS